MNDHGNDTDVCWNLARTMRLLGQSVLSLAGVLVLPLMLGCSGAKYMHPERMERGYAVVLPGIEGASWINTNIAKGLKNGGWPGAIEVYDWTPGNVVLFPVSLRYLERNKQQARIIAEKIVEYQNRYPDRPVHLIGHSGGGGVAVLALEALPPENPITSAILLAPAISPEYDLRRAMRRTEYGIWNYYSRYDVGFLKAGTTVMGTIDGSHTSAAGAVGFNMPWGLDDEDRRMYGEKLHQQGYSKKMADAGHIGGHLGWAHPRFVAQWLTPVLLTQMETMPELAADVD